MRVISFLPGAGKELLRSAISSDNVVDALDWDAFSREAISGEYDLAVSKVDSDRSVRQLISLSSVCVAATALVAFIPLSQSTVAHVVMLCRESNVISLSLPSNQSPSLVRTALLDAIDGHIGLNLLCRIISDKQRLPPRLYKALQGLIAHPERFASASDIALAAEVSRLTCYRYLRRVGILSPRRLFVGARLVKFYVHAADRGESILQAALCAGYAEPRLLAVHCHAAFGMLPRALQALPSNDFLVRLYTWVTDNSQCVL